MLAGPELKITVELVDALDTVLNSAFTTPEPTVLLPLARYIDLLANGHGLSEHRDVTSDRLVMAQRKLPEPAVDLVKHFIPESVANSADDMRARLYTVFVDLDGDMRVRGLVDDVLALGQIYWNISRTGDRPLLPIPSDQKITIGGKSIAADIRVPGVNKDFAHMVWTSRINEQGAYTSSSGGLRKQGACLAVLAAKHIIDGTSTALPDFASAVLERSRNEAGKLSISIGWPDPDLVSAGPDPLGPDRRSVIEEGSAGAMIPTVTSRARAYHAIDSFEQDLRQFVESRLLVGLPPEEVFGAEYDQLSARRARDDASETGPLTPYLHPHHAYDALLRNADALPRELSEVLRMNLSVFDGFLEVRNRLMHGRPLQPDDLEGTDSFLRRFRSGHFRQTELALADLTADSGWQPRPRLGSQPPERILHNLPSPDFDETGLLGRDEQVRAIVGMVKRRREPITLVGEGGIGKTALALEVCYRLADDPEPPFEAILWTSLKSERLTPTGVLELTNAVRNVDGAARELGQAIDPSFQGSARDLADTLGEMKTLIVIDNLETALGNEVLDLYDALPDSVTFLFTSRVGIGQIERTVLVEPLEETSAALLFENFARDRRQIELSQKSPLGISEILIQLRYSPLAIRWYILSVESGQTPSDTLRNQEDLLRFCVENVVADLASDEMLLLQTLRALDRPVLLEELAVISEMDIDTLRSGAHRLLRSSLLVWSYVPDPDAMELGSELLTLSSTARAYLRTVPGTEVAPDVVRRDIAYNEEREEERERIAQRGRYLDPNVMFERSAGDAPTAHLLKQALRENKSGHPIAASATMSRARAINPGYFEVDRVDAILAGYRRATDEATALFRSALISCDTEEESSWVGYFFASHLARQVHDIPGAIEMTKKSHAFFDSYETALQLGNFNVWDFRFEVGRRLIESAFEHGPLKPRFERTATTALVDCFRRWSEACVDDDPVASLDRALRGASLGIALHESGTTDEPLMRSILLAAVAARRASRRQEELGSDEEASLAAVTQRINADGRFALVLEWRKFIETIDPSAERMQGTVFSVHEKFGFIAHKDFPSRVFFHGGSLSFPTTLDDLEVGALVEFTPSKNAKGQDQALHVLLSGQDGEPRSEAAK